MKIYHFTAKHLLESIKKQGLTLGGIPLQKNNQIKFLTKCQWLTKRNGWDQAFHDPQLTELKYDRREVRLKIVIPASRRKNLMNVNRIEKIFGDDLIEGFFDDPDCKNWFMFYGLVKAQWIRRIDFNPDL